MRRTLLLLWWLAALAPAAVLPAQQPAPFAELPDSVARRIVEFYNDPTTTRLSGEILIAEGGTIGGRVAVLGGPVRVAGRVDGELIVINGDLRLQPGAAVTGPVTVVGGAVEGEQLAVLGGGLTHYLEPLRFRSVSEGIAYVPDVQPELSAGREFRFGRTDLLVAVRGAYNRVEGLPVTLGPRIRLGRGNPTLLEGLVVYRTTTGLRLEPRELGYSARVEQYVGGGRTARVGLRAYSEITPLEAWGVSDRESSLATFVLHRDYRDAYEREGWAAYLRFTRPGWPHDLTLEYRDERHGSAAAASPWSLFDNEEPWRPQPLVAEGTLRSLFARLTYDTRNEEAEPSAGWHIRAELEQGLGGVLRQPPSLDAGDPGGDGGSPAIGARARFTAALIDLRRYLRLGPGSRMAVRVVASGSADGTALPPQRQQTLGGEGSLPGYPLFHFDCGARSRQVQIDDDIFFPYYGCDRLALLQLEYQASFPFAARLGHQLGLDLGQIARWAVFFDAGRAWTEADALGGRLRGSSEFSADAGLGIRLGRIGAYWAVPLSSGGEGPNFFVRIGRRL